MTHHKETIQEARLAIDSAPEDHPNRADLLHGFADLLFTCYEKTAEIDELEEAIQVGRRATDLTPKDHPQRLLWLHAFGIMLERRYLRRGETADLEEAIQAVRKVTDLILEDDPNRASYFYKLGNLLRYRFIITGEIADVEEAIQAVKKAVDTIPEVHPSWVGFSQILAALLEARYERTGEITNLQDAVQKTRKIINSIPKNHPDTASHFNSLVTKLKLSYEQTGAVADLEEAIQVARQAVSLTPDNPAYLANLGVTLSLYYGRMGQVAHLKEAIRAAEQAVNLTPKDHPSRPIYLNGLAGGLEARYQQTGQMADLEEATRIIQEAVDLTPETHSNKPLFLHNLGNMLEIYYKRTENVVQLEEIIQIARQVVSLTLSGHSRMANYLNSLGTKLRMRYGQMGELADLDEAIEVAKQVVNLTPKDHPSRAGYLSNVALTLLDRYRQTGEAANLEEALQSAEQAAELTPKDDPVLADILYVLALMLLTRGLQTRKETDVKEALTHLQSAWGCQAATPLSRVKAASACLKNLYFFDNSDTAAQLGKDLLDFLPTINTRLLSRNDQQFIVRTFAGVAAELCAHLLTLGLQNDALEYLEKGRAVILSQLVDRWSDVSLLMEEHSNIAWRFEKLRNEVNTPLDNPQSDEAGKRMLMRRQEAANELDACIRQIRLIPGQGRFLLGQTTAEMQECAGTGTIVIINVTGFRSDAILVSASTIKTMALSQLTSQDVKQWLSKDWKGKRSEKALKNKEYLDYLAWLWWVCVGPVVEEILSTHRGEDSPRVWWIGAGLGSSMPFHAAGTHSIHSEENAYSKVLSSYVPSIKVLGHAHSRARRARGAPGPFLVATMQTTPPRAPNMRPPADLRGVPDERQKVLTSRCDIAHFACHGLTDHKDPSNSGLLLQRSIDGGAAVEQDRLTMQKVSSLHLASARLVYLSACSTAENRAAQLQDEGIHVVSGFQVAGFPHVVGCLWPSVDRVCVEVASRFYARLLEGRGAEWCDEDVALALREAVMAARAEEPNMPLNWAQFVHYGL
ncbi:Small ribosomal subunit uS17B-like protein [Cladobotryum mycophilum]|uniref:Small ribosomal subunit uS17B-like protein n=1 Tax=Cladobotryum mycophilum TaxID=491253 RepID=A0ABR0SQN2_9HYPO